MRKFFGLLLLSTLVLTAGCFWKKSSPYNRTSDKEDYEYFLSKHIFAACLNIDKPYATYSLAKLLQRPSNNDPRYKITFVNGPCKGLTVMTTHVITKTEPIGNGELPTGTLLLRNYWNPKEPFDQERLDRWNIGIVSDTSRLGKGIVDLEFPRDNQDFNPAREAVYTHNARYIQAPEVKDVRTFIR